MMTRAVAPFLSDLLHRAWPPVPEAVRDDVARLRYASMQAQVPLLYATTMMVVAITMMVAHPEAGFWIRFGLPGGIIATCCVRLTWWLRHRSGTPDAATARRRMIQMTIIASGIAFTASVWASFGWAQSVPGERSYYPMFMAIGLLSAAFCMSTIRATAIWLLLVGLIPILATLTIIGGRMEHTAAVLVTLSAMFLIRLIAQRHDQLVTLLELQQQMRELAATDPLTGLANRRRLLDRLGTALQQGLRPAVLLLDLDGFKPVNDAHGHAVGDDLLCAIGNRLRGAVGADMLVSRLGGDEFAVMLDDADTARARAVADGLLAALVEPITIGTVRLRVGASLGYVVAARGESDPHALIAAADTRLYAAKAAGRQIGPVARPGAKSAVPIRRSGNRG